MNVRYMRCPTFDELVGTICCYARARVKASRLAQAKGNIDTTRAAFEEMVSCEDTLLYTARCLEKYYEGKR